MAVPSTPILNGCDTVVPLMSTMTTSAPGAPATNTPCSVVNAGEVAFEVLDGFVNTGPDGNSGMTTGSVGTVAWSMTGPNARGFFRSSSTKLYPIETPTKTP